MQIYKHTQTLAHLEEIANTHTHAHISLWLQQCWSQSIYSLGNVTAKAKTTARAVVTSPSMEILLMYAEPGVNTKGELGILVAIIGRQDPTQYLMHSNIGGKLTIILWFSKYSPFEFQTKTSQNIAKFLTLWFSFLKSLMQNVISWSRSQKGVWSLQGWRGGRKELHFSGEIQRTKV